MMPEPDHLRVLEFYPDNCRARTVESLGSGGGFSGAQFWRLHTAAGTLCLRRWPKEHPSIGGLEFIQAVLWYVAREGYELVPVPLENRHRGGYVHHGDYLWEITPWMPGKADFRREPTDERLRAAMTALARFHIAAATFPLPNEAMSRSPGIAARLVQLESWMSGGLERLAAAIRPDLWPQMEDRARKIIAMVPAAAPKLWPLLSRAAQHDVRIQPCIRDIWHNHVLYQGGQVSGLIDFGSMQPENVAADVARLLGSMARDETNLRRAGLDAYSRVRPLSEAEQDLVAAFDRSTVLMAGLNWLDWIYAQGRRFENSATVLARVDEILVRLTHLTEL
jgi:Ser/Thr protein kinase RdoA (MazF antagonist)